ncbi:unnamed protein product [Prorocentrum cordatum]|uniref:EXPERA domain-containing protein n=1 Tax=Prorocentrum cordatum TaxID=2364126 RepID=A0ABN9UKW5_9DINO|nr:unnamed protein product [Polarella glacialis]
MTPCGCCKLSTQRSSWTLHRFTYSVLGRKTAGESRRYKLKPPADHHGTKTSIDKVVLAVEVPAGIIDGALCALWLKAILDNAWYRLPTQLTVSALHAFGTVIFWADELVPGYMNWFKGKGWKWTHTDGPKSIHWWWAFVGSNAVWVVETADQFQHLRFRLGHRDQGSPTRRGESGCRCCTARARSTA